MAMLKSAQGSLKSEHADARGVVELAKKKKKKYKHAVLKLTHDILAFIPTLMSGPW
jgi:hypothetical protein